MWTIGAMLLATTLVASNAFAAGSAAPLPSGKPAGVTQAARSGLNYGVILLGAGVVIGGLALTLTGNKKGITSGVSTSTTTP